MKVKRPHSHLRSALRPTRRLVVILALAAATTIAACGSSAQTSLTARTPKGAGHAPKGTGHAPKGTGHTRAQLVRSDLNFSKCMRRNGVPSFPDLMGTGMHIAADGSTLSVNGVSVSAPAFQSARQKCQEYLPAGIEPGPAKQAQQYARSLRFSKCMRSHGVSNFPDPKTVSGSRGNSVVELSGVNLSSPAVTAAARACGGGPKGP